MQAESFFLCNGFAVFAGGNLKRYCLEIAAEGENHAHALTKGNVSTLNLLDICCFTIFLPRISMLNALDVDLA